MRANLSSRKKTSKGVQKRIQASKDLNGNVGWQVPGTPSGSRYPLDTQLSIMLKRRR